MKIKPIDFIKSFINRTFYKGAEYSRLNADFQHASNSDFEELASGERDIMRARARWLYENNPIIGNIDEAIKLNTVGTGITLQSKITDIPNSDYLNREIELIFNDWCGECDLTNRMNFYELQELILQERMVDGEILINKTYDKRNSLQLQLIDSSRFDNTKMKLQDGKQLIIGGVEIDRVGRVQKYHILDDGYSLKSIELNSNQLIHYLRYGKNTQYRGVTEYKRTITDLKQFMAYQDSTVIGARARANIAYAIKTMGNSAGKLQKDETGKAIKRVTAGMVKYLRPGEEIVQLEPKEVGDNYNDFVTTAIRMISIARSVSYELAFRDYSQVNFSSARASIIQDNKLFDYNQMHLIRKVLTPIYSDFLDSIVLSGKIKKLNPSDYFRNRNLYFKPWWIPPKREWVDPAKDLKSLQMEIELGINSRTNIAKSKGRDWDEILEELKNEEEIMRKIRGESSDKKEV